VKVYRLERNGYGIFCEWKSRVDMNFPEDALYNEFGYTCARQYRDLDDYRSACESLDKLIEYFGSDFAYCLEKGASIVEYNIHKAHVRFGLEPEESIEVVFNSAKVIDKHIILKGEDDDDNS
jgi:hypothetical protein